MSAFEGLLHGFGVALQPQNLWWCIAGCFLGTVIGILPGLGPAATIAILLPLTFGMDPTSGIIMLAGIYYGAKYGGSTTSILLNMPGEASSWCPASTATRWPSAAAPAPRWRSRPSHRSSPAPSAS
jgi:putative tricarboxylic transport membrane protein